MTVSRKSKKRLLLPINQTFGYTPTSDTILRMHDPSSAFHRGGQAGSIPAFWSHDLPTLASSRTLPWLTTSITRSINPRKLCPFGNSLGFHDGLFSHGEAFFAFRDAFLSLL